MTLFDRRASARRVRLSAAVLASLLLPLVPQARQEPQPGQAPTFRTGANLVLADVFVTRDGKPVTDLTAAEVTIHEDGVLQTIRSFEPVVIPAGGLPIPSAARPPSTVTGSRALASDPRRRAFVLFLDTYHVTQEASATVSTPLLDFLDRILGPEDVLAVMTPAMQPSDLVFAPKTGALRDWLASRPKWGVREEWVFTPTHEEEERLQTCARWLDANNFRALLRRWREKRALDALGELVAHLDGIREGRKSVLVVSEGWELYRSDERLERVPDGRVPGPGRIGVGPGGTLGTGDRRVMKSVPDEVCDGLRQRIAHDETRLQFRNDVIGEANRANVSFYTIDPRGLPVFDREASAPGIRTVGADTESLGSRIGTLRTLAEATDGLAIVNTRAHREGLRRIAADLTSYYLIGYQSTNAASDGTYRKLRITVSRPGVQVRTRDGYRAPLPGAPPRGGADATARASSPVEVAIASLVELRPDLPLLVQADMAGGALQPGASRVVHVVAELGPAASREAAWARGGTAHFTLKSADGAIAAATEVPLPPGTMAVEGELDAGTADAGTQRVHVRLQSATVPGSTGGLTSTVAIRTWPAGLAWGAPRLYRRGPSTGLRYLPTADPRFRRQERLRLELPAAAGTTPPAVRVTDRRGTPLNLPATVTPATSGPAPIVVDLPLAALAAGDYAIVLLGPDGSPPTVVPFRIVP